MRYVAIVFLIVLFCASAALKIRSAQSKQTAFTQFTVELHARRQSPTDLEIGGDWSGIPAGTTRYLSREQLLKLPQVTYTATDDANFQPGTRIQGVPLEQLPRYLGAPATANLIVAVCDDKYRAYYPRDYLGRHHPLLVLEVNGKPPSGWPRDAAEHNFDLGPYMISHPKFTPDPNAEPHTDEAQIPWGVIRLDFSDEHTVFGPIMPRGPRSKDATVQQGYKIARQNCFRCHNMGAQGGQKSGVAWTTLSKLATQLPDFFADYVRNPASKNRKAQMPGSPDYDAATIQSLVAYFQAVVQPKKP